MSPYVKFLSQLVKHGPLISGRGSQALREVFWPRPRQRRTICSLSAVQLRDRGHRIETGAL
jgi:hypothetical protein